MAAAAVVVLLLTGCADSAPEQAAFTTAPSVTASAAPTPAPTPAPTSAAVPTPSATTPTAAPTAAPPAPTPSAPAAPAPDALPPVMEESAPVSVRIPSVGTESGLLSLGLRENGSLDVPPGDPGSPAAWYNGSPTPGERGPAVLLGHVNATDGGPGVFADLRSLTPGDTVEVLREDGSTAVFAVDRGEQYGKDAFPTLSVYGNTEGSELRLITCDGYDPATGEFDDNYVVYAKLVS